MCYDALCAEIFLLCSDIHRAEFRLLELIGELDAQRPWRHEAMPSCAHWLNAHCGIDLVTAREKVRIARALPELPLAADVEHFAVAARQYAHHGDRSRGVRQGQRVRAEDHVSHDGRHA